MVSIFDKVRAVTLGNLHSLLDKATDANSIPVLEQHLRDLQAARADLEGELSEAKYALNQRQGKAATQQRNITEMEGQATSLMQVNGGNPSAQQKEAALNLAKKVIATKREMAEEAAMLEEAQTMVTQLTAAVQKVTTKENEHLRALEHLRSTDSSSKAKARATSALEAVTAATENAGSLDNLSDRIGRQNARNSDAFDKAVAGVKGDTVLEDASAEALLAQLASK